MCVDTKKTISNSKRLWNCWKWVLTGTLRLTGDPQSCLLLYSCHTLTKPVEPFGVVAVQVMDSV